MKPCPNCKKHTSLLLIRMDVQHAWNVALVVLSLLTVVLVISTSIITTCLRRENKMFYKRLARKSRISTTSNDLDMTELRGLLEKYTTVYCLSRDKIRYRIGNICFLFVLCFILQDRKYWKYLLKLRKIMGIAVGRKDISLS